MPESLVALFCKSSGWFIHTPHPTHDKLLKPSKSSTEQLNKKKEVLHMQVIHYIPMNPIKFLMKKS